MFISCVKKKAQNRWTPNPKLSLCSSLTSTAQDEVSYQIRLALLREEMARARTKKNGDSVPHLAIVIIWVFPKNRGKTPKMDGENTGKPYFLMDDWMIGFKHFLCSSRTLGRWTQFDEHIFQRGWFNHQLAIVCMQPVQRLGKVWPHEVPWLLKARTVKICAGEILLPSGCSSGRSSSFAWSKWSVSPNSNECSDVFLTSLILCFEVSKVGFFNEYIRDQEEFDVKHINSSKLILPLCLS